MLLETDAGGDTEAAYTVAPAQYGEVLTQRKDHLTPKEPTTYISRRQQVYGRWRERGESAMKRCLLMGAGNWGRAMWIDEVLPAFADRVQVAGLVDIDEEVLADSGRALKLDDEALFTDIQEAVDQVEADFCIVVTSADAHKQAALAAAEKGMAILSEKPLADSMAAALDIYRAVKAAGVPMTVVQQYRYEPHFWTLRQLLRSGRVGRLNYLVGRFAKHYKEGEVPAWYLKLWLISSAVHHFDMLRNLTGANAVTVEGFSWNPPWSAFEDDCCGLFVLEMSNGARAFYEGSCTNVGKLHTWYHEYYRAECEEATAEVDSDQVVRIWRGDQEPEVVPLSQPEYTGHHQIMHDFLACLETGEPTETCLDDNIKSFAISCAAAQAVKTGRRVQVASLLP